MPRRAPPPGEDPETATPVGAGPRARPHEMGDHVHSQVRAYGSLAQEVMDAGDRNAVRTLGASVEKLGHTQREQGEAACVASYEEAVSLYQASGDRPAEANAAFSLGHAYKNLPPLRDLDRAGDWYLRSLDLRAAGDRLGRGKCWNQLGLVAYERFLNARYAGAPAAELLRHLNEAASYCHQVLDLLPRDAVDDLAVTHNQLGSIYLDAGDLDRALGHYRESIRYSEAAGALYNAAIARRNVAAALARAGRYPDALAYARAALDNYATFGERAAAKIQQTQRLIANFERDMQP